jgi:hypothetical protein
VACSFSKILRVHTQTTRQHKQGEPNAGLLPCSCRRETDHFLFYYYIATYIHKPSNNMFYSETLLSKTGPLARVWLSANLERKLSKTHILQSNIESSVSAIVDQGQAPMALRLSGQLLLGVVRIYSRKARYLLDDCNEALLKIKMVWYTQPIPILCSYFVGFSSRQCRLTNEPKCL